MEGNYSCKIVYLWLLLLEGIWASLIGCTVRAWFELLPKSPPALLSISSCAGDATVSSLEGLEALKNTSFEDNDCGLWTWGTIGTSDGA